MANFETKPWTNPFGKNSIFRLSQHPFFVAQKGVKKLQNTIKHIFLAYITFKKEDGKMANFGPKPWTNPFGKYYIFRLSQHLVFIAQKYVLSLYNTIENIFLAYTALKKADGKMANFGPKPWTNPIGKNSTFRLSQHIVFIAQKGHLSLQNTIKHIFLDSIALKKKKMEKWPILDQNYGLTPFEKIQLIDILNILFLQPRKAFYRYRIP